MEEKILQTERLAVGYQGEALIREIGFDLSRGEIVSLIGPNGAGKSTILKSIARQLKRIGGQIRIGGQPLDSYTEKGLARKIAIVFTEKIEPELMTVQDVVEMGRYPYTNRLGILTAQDRRAAEEAMELVKVAGLRSHGFARLSDGQKQRVLLARAICQEPDILVLDEPTSYLDIRYKVEFLSVLQKLAREKKLGVLMSLHELDLAERISDKILCVQGERIEHYGTPEEIFKDGFVQKLYGMECGSFDEYTGSLELERNAGAARVFVIAGNRTGCHVFRTLQRQGLPFSVGILSENDLDYPTARALAVRVIAEPAFEEFSGNAYELARREMLSCEYVICCLKRFGPQNRMNERLLEDARQAGMEIREVNGETYTSFNLCLENSGLGLGDLL